MSFEIRMQLGKTITTERLVLDQLSVGDTDFVFELVNTPGWLKFIGDKKIYSLADAEAYILKINASGNIYWTVKLKADNSSIGLITFIKRDYLSHHDLGFAFLPNFNAQGFAYEAAKAVLTYLAACKDINAILAISLPNNARSISLLQKLGFQFKQSVKNDSDLLHLYEASLTG